MLDLDRTATQLSLRAAARAPDGFGSRRLVCPPQEPVTFHGGWYTAAPVEFLVVPRVCCLVVR